MYKNYNNIEINILNINDLYAENNIISSNIKMLNKNLEDYILSKAKNYKLKEKVNLMLKVNCKAGQDLCTGIEATIHRHFAFKEIETAIYMKQALKQWRINLFIGVLFLILCLLLVEVLEPFTYIKTLKFIKEGLLIISWVALWDPVTFILFNLRTINRDANYFHKLSQIPVKINFSSHGNKISK